MNKQIVIYDAVTLMPRYTVEPPYSEDIKQFYIDLVAGDETIAMAEVDMCTIMDKCIQEVEGEYQLCDRPDQELTGELVDNIFTISNLQPYSKIIVDNLMTYEFDENTTQEIELDTTGVYHLKIIKEPYADFDFTVEYND